MRLQMQFQKYWHLKAVDGWCVSIPHTDGDLLEILDSVTLSSGIEVVSTSHGLYGDTMYLKFTGASLTKTKREKFLALVEQDCEFWPQKAITVETLQLFGQAPLYLIFVEDTWRFMSLKEAHVHYTGGRICKGDIGNFILNVDLTCTNMSELEKRLIWETETN